MLSPFVKLPRRATISQERPSSHSGRGPYDTVTRTTHRAARHRGYYTQGMFHELVGGRWGASALVGLDSSFRRTVALLPISLADGRATFSSKTRCAEQLENRFPAVQHSATG